MMFDLWFGELVHLGASPGYVGLNEAGLVLWMSGDYGPEDYFWWRGLETIEEREAEG